MAIDRTVARPYARAAFAVAHAENTVDAWQAMLDGLAAAIQDPKVRRRLIAPTEQAKTLVADIAQSFDTVSASAVRFVHAMASAGRLAVIGAVAAHFSVLKDARNDICRVYIESAYPLSKKEQQALHDAMARRVDHAVSMTITVHPALIGGIRIRIGDSVLDKTIRADVARLANCVMGK